jgi:hypothetical protein
VETIPTMKWAKTCLLGLRPDGGVYGAGAEEEEEEAGEGEEVVVLGEVEGGLSVKPGIPRVMERDNAASTSAVVLVRKDVIGLGSDEAGEIVEVEIEAAEVDVALSSIFHQTRHLYGVVL